MRPDFDLLRRIAFFYIIFISLFSIIQQTILALPFIEAEKIGIKYGVLPSNGLVEVETNTPVATLYYNTSTSTPITESYLSFINNTATTINVTLYQNYSSLLNTTSNTTATDLNTLCKLYAENPSIFDDNMKQILASQCDIYEQTAVMSTSSFITAFMGWIYMAILIIPKIFVSVIAFPIYLYYKLSPLWSYVPAEVNIIIIILMSVWQLIHWVMLQFAVSYIISR